MKNVFGTLTLAISKTTNQAFEELIMKLSDLNIEAVEGVQLRSVDGTLHSVKIEDFFINWEKPEDEE